MFPVYKVMITFMQYVESKDEFYVPRIFTTRDADYQIPLASDRVEDTNDLKYLIIPLMKKVKAFGHYCEMARKDISTFMPGPSMFNREDQIGNNRYLANSARINSLRTLAGKSLSRYLPGENQNLINLLRKVNIECGILVDRYQAHAPSNSTELMKHFDSDLKYIIKSLEAVVECNAEHLPIDVEDAVNNIKDRVSRMIAFLKTAQSQMHRFAGMKLPAKLRSGYDGMFGTQNN